MKVEKLPSGNYRVRKMVNGKSYSMTFSHKPTNKEVLFALQERMKEEDSRKECPSEEDALHSMKNPEPTLKKGGSYPASCFYSAARTYIDAKEAVLSPSTIPGYESILRNLSKEFLETPLSEITALKVQQEVNRYAKNHSPKSVKNLHAFLAAVINLFSPETTLATTLPQEELPAFYEPTKEDVERILHYAKDTPYEVALHLAALGLRKSEILALRVADLDEDNILHIHRSRVLDKDNHMVTRNKNKTKDSTRLLPLPKEVADLIREKGCIYKGKPRNILRFLRRAQDNLGIPQFRLHDLRHYFAAAVSEQTDEATCLYLGGWKTDYVMKRRYRYSLKKNNAEYLRNVLSNISSNSPTV